jgi:general secretion pathway protein I
MLIEVVVAFAIFALTIGALYESFTGAIRREAQAQERAQALLVAQSVLEELRARPGPWSGEDSGTVGSGWRWRAQVAAAFDTTKDEDNRWQAFVVTLSVAHQGVDARETTLRSVELFRNRP